MRDASTWETPLESTISAQAAEIVRFNRAPGTIASGTMRFTRDASVRGRLNAVTARRANLLARQMSVAKRKPE